MIEPAKICILFQEKLCFRSFNSKTHRFVPIRNIKFLVFISVNCKLGRERNSFMKKKTQNSEKECNKLLTKKKEIMDENVAFKFNSLSENNT